jgi:HD-GYP domain-containing protein (c-di-GMP phosphodiesterase class II)
MKTLIAPVLDPYPQQALNMARSLVALIGLRDHYTTSHSARVANYAHDIAYRLGLSDDEIGTIRFAAAMHDIGKTGIPDHILLKAGKLNSEEYAWIQKCPEWGWMTLSHIEEFQQAATIVLHQRENVDGSGYPNGLRGQDIPIGSRIIAVADCYDALTNDRPYRSAISNAAAVDEITRCCGVKFDTEVVNTFRRILEERNQE